MKTYRSILGLSVAMFLTAGFAAQAGLFDDFEGYALGSNLHGQGDWKGWDNAPGAGGTISSAFAASGAQSLMIEGTSDLVRTFSGFENGMYAVSLKQYIPSSSTGQTYVILLNRYQDGGPNDWSVQMEGQLNLNAIVSDFGQTSVAMIKDAWVEYRFDIDTSANTVSEYYNNQLVSTHQWRDLADPDGRNALGALDLFANGAGPVYYDDLSVQVVPEPSTIALVILGGLVLAAVRRRAH